MFCEFLGLRGLEWPQLSLVWANPVTSDLITQIVKFVGAKALFSGVDLEPSLLEAGGNLFKDSKMFCPRAFCNMQKVIDVNTYYV